MVVLTPKREAGHARRWRGVGRLACAILGHRPGQGAAWNHGYCFAHCARCGGPILRAVFGGWRTPPAGYRIVWPDERDDRARPGGGLRAVADGDFMTDGAAIPQPRRADAVVLGDFMAEDADTSPTEPPRRRQAR